jgi:hypothetical protein
MDRIKGRWADTELADDNVTGYVWRPQGCDQQGRYPEAAHAASELDDYDPRPIPGAGPVAWLVLGVVALLAVAAGWHVVAGWLA